MDLTPPLTRSPASTPKTYCPSEASSSDYPTPDMVEQHYRISSAYHADPICSMDPSLTPDCHSPRLDAITEAEWSPASVLHPSLTTASMAAILSAEYDVFAPYDGSCSSHFYSERDPHSPQPSLPVSRSTSSALSKPSLHNSPISRPSTPGTPKCKPEDLSSEYGHSIEASQYPSPSMGNEPYPLQISSRPSLPPLGPPSQSSGGYNPEPMLASWPRSPEYPACSEPEQLYTGASIQPSTMQMLSVRHEPTGSPRGQERPRRPPRKLTTKEEANFQCDIKGCGKFFSRSYNFKAHMETHREKREYPFPCQVADCTKRFVRKTDLQRHTQSVHMKERNHGCEYCGRMFARRDTLKRYAPIHPRSK
ncbi:hypothetical protein N0V82_008111 [Gnomoniopsis sp. IMI 355080]|nr:hypothetical protein N0V82_008111 [Gnomoniopsis sp. IMI 355080]